MNRSMMEMTDALNKEFDNLVKYCMDGVEVTKLIREKQDDYFKNVPIIALTVRYYYGWLYVRSRKNKRNRKNK